MFRIVHIILLLLPLAACPGSREQAKDSGGAPAEGGSFTDGAATRLLCDNDCTDLVVDRILLPTSTAEANKYGLVLGGKTYNGLGTIISLVNQYASTSGLQDDVDGAVYKGDTLVLLKLQASDLVNASQVKAQAWGGSASCCVAGKDLAACKTEARSRCFNGTSVIQKAAGSPENMIFSGAITAGVASLSSSTMKLEIKLNLSSTLKLTLKHARLTGKVTATAFREAVRRVGAESRATNAVVGAGVDVFDKSTGKMRSIVDIMSDFAQATSSMTDAERNRRVATAFGARGLLAFNAVLNASFTTTRDGAKVTLQGAEAIAALRKEMGQASGTAASFREQLLDTFEGQKTLLKGTLQTFAVVLGEPFAAVFKPVVRVLVDVLNAILRAFQAIPAPIKKVLAGVVLAAGAFLALVGGIIAAKATIALLAIGLKALGLSLGGLMATMLPAILIVGALAAVVAAFAVAFKKNLGGIGDFARRLWRRVTLLFQGLKQLFEQGGFSGAVRKELARAENSGLKRFLIAVYQIAYRIGRIWEGFKQGFTSTIEEARPVFQDLVDALSALGREVAAIFSGVTGGAASLPSSQFKSFGQVAGAAIATVITWVTRLATILLRYWSGIARGFGSMIEYIKPALMVVREALGELVAAWGKLMGDTQDASVAAGTSAGSWRSLGVVIGKIVGGAVTVITLALGGLIKVLTAVVWAVNVVKDVFVAVGTVIGETVAKIYLWFTQTLPAAISSAVSTVVGFFQRIGAFFARIGRWFQGLFASMASGIKSFFKPVVDFFEGVLRTVRRVIDGIQDFVIKLLRKIPAKLLPSHLVQLSRQPLSTELRGRGELRAEGGTAATAARAEAASSAMPAAAATRGRSDQMARLEASMQTQAGAGAKGRGQAPPLNINVQVDGETIARASHNASRDVAGRSFSPVPAY